MPEYSDRTAKGAPAEIAKLTKKWAKEDAEWAETAKVAVPAAKAEPAVDDAVKPEPEPKLAKAETKKEKS